MYSLIADQRLRVMTAAEGCQTPTLDVVRQLPIIQMSLAEIYRSSEKSRASAHDVLRESAIPQPKCCPDFGRKLPKIITGEDESWQLWRVDFYVARLQLYYIESAVRSEGYHLTGGTALDSIGTSVAAPPPTSSRLSLSALISTSPSLIGISATT